ncbi:MULTISPECIES: hypothetical protein [unclassified Streptomyces]|uniref:hypothetical protein n=1 Tax=unclassified Streptomyces TaxID=2593676 RepID=UPI00088F74D2|nr:MULTISPECIES: hypothetical protein [unclassified Streptomyces]PBC85727.1 hypothetical protein BX261_5750 [Streptomyces sp. 2321.6]SDR07535.1 hypothetical protein SAMN05216511_1513 [Streptomyces sp. KS_16]SED77258.1 hypothetical protein SAMN05428940_5776 [Streptomyces sp. 2133.1]SNC72598.1 hypothetical protein SAMN06272741_5677 [Streptomyces sp. 2114.4]
MAPERSVPHRGRRPGRGRAAARGAARLLAAAGLALDTYVHARLAGRYDGVTATISQGLLFRIEAALAALAAVLVLVWRRPAADTFAWLVATGGLALLLLYTYVDIGAPGPLPDMYEPGWSADKKLAALAQAVAVLATVFLLLTRTRGLARHRR